MITLPYILQFFCLTASTLVCCDDFLRLPEENQSHIIVMRYETEGMTYDLERIGHVLDDENLRNEYLDYDQIMDGGFIPEVYVKEFGEWCKKIAFREGSPVFCPVEVTVRIEPTEIRLDETFTVKITAKNIGEIDTQHYRYELKVIDVWISNEHLKDQKFLCWRVLDYSPHYNFMIWMYSPRGPIFSYSTTPLPKGEEIELYDMKYKLEGSQNAKWWFWRTWLELPDDLKRDCQINLRIQHPGNPIVYIFSHPITIRPIPECAIDPKQDRAIQTEDSK